MRDSPAQGRPLDGNRELSKQVVLPAPGPAAAGESLGLRAGEAACKVMLIGLNKTGAAPVFLEDECCRKEGLLLRSLTWCRENATVKCKRML